MTLAISDEQGSSGRLKRLYDWFSDPLTDVYVLFLQLVISKFDKVNLKFQWDKPCIHLVHDTLSLHSDPVDSFLVTYDDDPYIAYLPGKMNFVSLILPSSPLFLYSFIQFRPKAALQFLQNEAGFIYTYTWRYTTVYLCYLHVDAKLKIGLVTKMKLKSLNLSIWGTEVPSSSKDILLLSADLCK